jgi:hypothetical protein
MGIVTIEAFCFDLFSGMLGTSPFNMTGNTEPLGLYLVTTTPTRGTFCPGRKMAHLTAICPGHLGRHRTMHVFNFSQRLMTPSVHTSFSNGFINRHTEDDKKDHKSEAKKQPGAHLFFLLFSTR